jgi:alkaline phosphatase
MKSNYFLILKASSIVFVIGFLALISIPVKTMAQDTESLNKSRSTPKNIIYIIGDGMGFSQVQAAIMASDEPLNFSRFPVTGMSQTKSYDNVITDSGAAGTVLATGKKTRNGMIGMTPDSIEIKSMIDIFSSLGKSTGVVTTCALTHATPASFLAHDISRNNYEAIAADISTSPVDVLIGGGMANFTIRKDGRDLVEEMKLNGWEVLTCLMEAEGKSPKLLVFTSDEHPVAANKGREDEMQHSVSVAIDALKGDPDGFFLMIEGSQIDWAGHDNDSAYLVAEMLDFDRTLGVVLDFAELDGNTLVVVTADHETGGLSLPQDPRNPQKKSRLSFSTTDHTASMVPVFSFGPSALHFTGMYDNTEIFRKIIFSTNIAR